MTRRKANFGRLLAAFPDRAGKPEATGRHKSIRLPSAAELLAIDARAEADAKRARIAAVTFGPIGGTSSGSGPQTGQDGATTPAPV